MARKETTTAIPMPARAPLESEEVEVFGGCVGPVVALDVGEEVVDELVVTGVKFVEEEVISPISRNMSVSVASQDTDMGLQAAEFTAVKVIESTVSVAESQVYWPNWLPPGCHTFVMTCACARPCTHCGP